MKICSNKKHNLIKHGEEFCPLCIAMNFNISTRQSSDNLLKLLREKDIEIKKLKLNIDNLMKVLRNG